MYVAAGSTFRGKAGTASVISYTLNVDEVTTTDAFNSTPQGTLAATTGILYTAPALTQTLITEVQGTSSSLSNIPVTFYLNGSTVAVWQGTVPAGGSFSYNGKGWNIYDSNGVFQSVGTTGPSGTISVGTVTNIGTTGPPTVTNVGTGTAAVLNFGLQQGATGSTGAPGVVQDVLATDSSITVTGTTAHPTISRAALTGDIAVGAGTNGTTLATVNANVGTFGSNTRIPTYTVNAKGLTTASSDAAVLTTPSGQTPVGATRNIATTAPLTGGGDMSADRTLAISAASTSAAGSQSAAQFNTVQNLWFDVTNYGVSIGNTGATNTAAMNTLISTTAGAGARFWFPQTGANYPFNGAILVTKNDQKFLGAGQYSSVLFQNSTTDDLFRVSDGVQNVTFDGLGLWSAVTMSAGSAINTGTVSGAGVAQLWVNNCGFQGFGGTWFNCITLNGNTGGEVSLVSYCQINSFTNYGIAQVGNTSTPSTVSSMVIENTTMNGQITGTTGAVAGIYVQQSGALNIDNSDVISCTNNVLFAPITSVSQIVASVYMINSFLDHSHGSCLKFGGTQPIVRIKLTASSFTVSNDAGGNYSAIEFANTATNPPGDVDILSCNIQNTFNATTTTNGILLTAAANVKIIGNNINGFTNNLQASAAASSATKLNIVGNSFGPGTVTAPTSTNDILLNAGTYGYIQITTNVFAPASPFQAVSTNHINDSSTVANSALKRFGDNIGIANTGLQASIPSASQTFTASVDNLITGTSIPLPTNGLLIGQRFVGNFRMEKTTLAGTATWSLKIKYGTLNTASDAAIATFTSGTNTAIVDNAAVTIYVEIVSLGAAATCKTYCIYGHGPGAAATGLGVIPLAAASTASFNSTSANPFLHVDVTPGAAAAMTGGGSFYQIG